MLTVNVTAKTFVARDICAFDLTSADGASLPAFTAGAHIDIHLPGNLVRQYSLCNAPAEPHRYQIAVLRDQASRGGSQRLHDQIQVGDTLQVSAPRNLFPLHDDSAPALLFAGGIGITPLLAMAEHLTLQKRRFSLHYCARSVDQAAFLDRIAASAFNACVTTYFSGQGQRLDAAAILATAEPETHLYVCGPPAFMDQSLDQARKLGWGATRLHREYFVAATPSNEIANQSFTLQIASTGQYIDVPADRTVADVLIEKGFDIPLSCEQGICGTCLTGVREGTPDHRDLFQTEEEQAANSHFTPCCSRSRSATLVLDM